MALPTRIRPCILTVSNIKNAKNYVCGRAANIYPEARYTLRQTGTDVANTSLTT